MENIKFSDILDMIPDRQIDISKKLCISRQLITDIKFKRKNMSVITLSKFINEYPNLPWLDYIKGLTK